jgi:fucose 4-O-acetylase-like acetyltransferase
VVARALAAIIGNAPFVKSASGFLMLWFLPCLFGLSCLLAAFDSLVSRRMKSFAVGLAIAAHLVVPFLPPAPMLWLPFGLAIAMDVFLLGLVWRQLLKCRLPRHWGSMAAAIFVASYGALVSAPVHLEVATLELVGIGRPWLLFLQDISGMAGVLTVVWLVGLSGKLHWLEPIGRNSLLVYLIHPVAYILLGRLWPATPGDDLAPSVLFAYGCLTICLAIGLAYALSVVVSRSPFLSAWIVPRSWNQWPPARMLARM